MGGQIKLKNNEALELSGCLARLAQSKVFQDLRIVCQVLCICCLAKAFRHFSGNLLVVGDEHCTTQCIPPIGSVIQYTHAIRSITDVTDKIYAKHPQYPVLEST